MSKNTVASGAETTQTQHGVGAEDLPDGLKVETVPFSMIPHWLLEPEMNLSGYAIKTYAVLMKVGNHNTRVASLSIARLAEYVGKSRSSVINYLSELKEAGALEVVPRYDNGEQVGSYYYLRTSQETVDNILVTPRTASWSPPGQHTGHNSRTHYSRTHIQEESEPDDSDAVIEPDTVDEDVETQTRLLDVLDDAVEANGFKRPSRTKGNQRAMRLLLTKDGYSETQVSWMIGWATDHHFWYKNIRSAEKLRQQFDRLVIEAKEQSGNGPRGGQPMNKAQARLQNNLSVVAQFEAMERERTGSDMRGLTR